MCEGALIFTNSLFSMLFLQHRNVEVAAHVTNILAL
jgi:hypothetical protein